MNGPPPSASPARPDARLVVDREPIDTLALGPFDMYLLGLRGFEARAAAVTIAEAMADAIAGGPRPLPPSKARACVLVGRLQRWISGLGGRQGFTIDGHYSSHVASVFWALYPQLVWRGDGSTPSLDERLGTELAYLVRKAQS